jgi:hypothetical protein
MSNILDADRSMDDFSDEDLPADTPCSVYIMVTEHVDGTYYKVGHAKKPESRRQGIQISNPTPLKLLFSLPFSSTMCAFEFENLMHEHLEEYASDGGTEWFEVDEEMVTTALFRALCDNSTGSSTSKPTISGELIELDYQNSSIVVIQLKLSTRERLKERGKKGESYDQIIIRLLDATKDRWR